MTGSCPGEFGTRSKYCIIARRAHGRGSAFQRSASEASFLGSWKRIRWSRNRSSPAEKSSSSNSGENAGGVGIGDSPDQPATSGESNERAPRAQADLGGKRAAG